MGVFRYQALELYRWLTAREDIVVLDVRNDKDFNRFHVEAPYPFELHNISYYEFMEEEEETVARVPKGRRIRIVCAKEGSAKYVADILAKHGFDDVGYLEGGIKSWGNLLVPCELHKGDDYTLYQFIRPGKASCSYALAVGDAMMLFDPSRNVDFYIDFAKEQGCRIIKTFETHLQADYIAGSRMIAERTGAEFLANENDFKDAKFDYTPLEDGEIHTFSDGGPQIRVVFTPGHTPGSTSFIVNETYMLSGDMIFLSSIGRPDLGGKAVDWAKLLFASLQKTAKFDDNLIILPGHYISWEEANDDLLFACPFSEVKKRNAQIYEIDREEDFIRFIQDNMRPQPEEYATIRQVNANLIQVDDEQAEILDLGKNECAASAYAKKQQAG